MLKQLSKISLVLALVAGVGLSLSPLTVSAAGTDEAQEPQAHHRFEALREHFRRLFVRMHLRANGHVATVNSVTVNDDGSGSMEVTAKESGETKTVEFDADTKFVRHFFGPGEADDIETGDHLLINGKANDDDTIDAHMVRDANVWVRGVAAHIGQILSVNTDTNTIVVESTRFHGEDKQVTVIYNDDAKIVKDGATVDEDAIDIGDDIRVRGTARKENEQPVFVENVTGIWLSAE